ncbi:olfactory receptor 6C2-like [Sus scrofa]|uniref:olfactory receptor 6C2-like n=1 Tax=Sus scrofa TaxID=9823 RepID=UPI000A2B564B|nr:olfactory receptor 6C2-like [Sus scrofa]
MQILIFLFLLLTYMLSLTGNLIILLLILVDSHLKTAMYFFLQNFSFLEISFTSACIPRFLYSISTGDRAITYNACACQLFFTYMFAVTEFFLLAAMSFDRYVAICKPLHYVTIMNHRVCRRIVFCCWMATLLIISPPFSFGLALEFCDSNVIDHFVCDVNPLLKIACSETRFIEQMTLAGSVLIFILTLVCVVLSYVCIFVYIKPSAKDEMTINKGVTILTTSISPMLNPFIYTLRNKQVKQAFNDLVQRIISLSKN